MEGLRKLQFMFTGYRNFTKTGKKMAALEGSLKGLNYIITGANSGLGLEAAKFAAEKGAKVFLVCRNPQRAESALKQLKEKTGSEHIDVILGELGEKKELDHIVEQINEKVGTVDVLVNNAGCMIHKREFTSDGIEKNFAVNTFSVYYLTKKLLPKMHQKSRVIVVSSGGMYTEKLVTDDIYMQKKTYDGTSQYARNKRQQLCIVEEFAKQLKQHGMFFTMHPGWVDTPAVREAMPDFYNKMKDDLRDVAEGADTINYLTIAPVEQLKNGQFYFDRKVADKHLTISGTTYSQQEVNKLMKRLKQLSEE